jgi:hypothetical protein
VTRGGVERNVSLYCLSTRNVTHGGEARASQDVADGRSVYYVQGTTPESSVYYVRRGEVRDVEDQTYLFLAGSQVLFFPR